MLGLGSNKCMCPTILPNTAVSDGSNTFGTMKFSSRHGKFELMSVNHSAKSGGIVSLYFRFSLT